MSVFLAAYALKWEPVQTDLLNEMCAVLTSAGTVNTYLHGSIAVAYVDMNLWPGKSTRVFAEGLSVFAGDPLLCDNDITYSRPDGIDILTSEISISGVSALRLAEGTFAGLVVDRHGNRLRAFTDKLGVRPIYWCQTGSHIFVSSTLWALQAMPGIRQSPNWNAAAETAAFGFPLGNRTLIEPFRVLGSGHALCVVENEVSDQCYWDWTKLPKNSLAGNPLLEHIEEAFHSAVDRRCIGQTKVMAFLSGGMDSRLIVSRLRAHRIRVHSLNFAPDGSQDLVFGRMVAERLGCNHFEYAEGDLGFADRQAVALTKWKLVNPDTNEHPERPGLVWSGDGGSVGLGFVYLSSSVIAIARTKGLLAAAQALQRDNKNYMPSAMLRAKSKSLAKLPLQGIVDDLESRPTTEPGHNCHLFYMLNDQRRHLANHFENLHERRVDLVLPFFDGRFLAAVLACPVDEFLEHRLYNDLMARLPNRVGQLPWQAYPGHIPNPIPYHGDLRGQWQEGWFSNSSVSRQSKKIQKVRRKQLIDASSAAKIINRPLAIALTFLNALGFDRYQHLSESTVPFLTAAALTSGKF